MIRRAYVDSVDGQIHYRHVAGPGTPLVCLHDAGSSSASCEALMQRMEGRRAFYALDIPGFGGSFDPPSMPNMSLYAAWIVEAVNGLGLAEFQLLGHRAGGNIALEMAGRHAHRVKALVLVGVQPVQAEGQAEAGDGPEPVADGSHLTRAWNQLAARGAGADLALHHREAMDLLRAWRGYGQLRAAARQHDLRKYLAAVSCPILILSAGDAPRADSDGPESLRPDARVVTSNGGEFVLDRDPEGLASALDAFLRD